MEWRHQGRVPLAYWRSYLSDWRSPLATEACWQAAGEHSRFLLSVAIGESQGGTHFNLNRPENKNALNLRPPLRPDGTRPPGDYMRFDRWEDGIRSARERITDNAYGNGIYARTRTVVEFARVWAPATDSNNPVAFAAGIEERIASYPRMEESMADITFGRVKHPAFTDRLITTKPEGVGWNNLGKREVDGVAWHRILGSLWGTDGFFRNPSVQAQTDYGVGVASIDGADNDGKILRWTDPEGFISGWASGPVSQPYGDGAAFVADRGVNAVNRFLASIEISGHQTTPLTPKARYAIAALTAYWADQNRIPWDVFPIIPGKGYSFVVWHEEVTWGTGKRCPFDVVKNETASLIELARAIMREAQVGAPAPDPEPAAPIYAPLNPPAFITPRWINGGEDAKIGTTKVWSLRRRWTARIETPRLQHTGANAPAVGPPVKAGESFVGIGLYHSHGEFWVLTEWGTRVRMADLTDAMVPGYPESEAA